MQVFQTDDEPPARGSRSLPIIGCTKNIRKAERKIVAVYRIIKEAAPCRCVGSAILAQQRHKCKAAQLLALRGMQKFSFCVVIYDIISH